MPFAYYRRLTKKQRQIYDQSDRVQALTLPAPEKLTPFVERLVSALKSERRTTVEAACRNLIDGVTDQLGVPAVRLRVMAVRPSDDSGELHGEYELALNRRRASICVWMRTAKRRQVVAFRSFLRTVLHELCHHLDYTLLNLDDSFHTEGFYKRESSLFNQLMAKPPQTP
ncbi:MAG TPA: hypothetical protein ENI80_05500 [Acidiferrobacteraceae bacterium]|nr:hypothetical protein [Acidiferrobacteraceae bacterium]